MNTGNEKDQLITQLTRETISGNIKWGVTQPPYAFTHATEKVVPLYLQTTFRGSSIGVYEIRYRHFTDEDTFYWLEDLGICIVNQDGIVTWNFEQYSPALNELYQMAREQASGLSSLLNG